MGRDCKVARAFSAMEESVRRTSHAINDHTFLEELELNCSREGAVGSVAWDIRSEGCTRLKNNREILIRHIRRQT
jgi:hypothetical protein